MRNVRARSDQRFQLSSVEEKARPILSRQTSELLAILEIEISSVSEENLLREFEGIFAGVENSETYRPNFMLMNLSSPLPQS